MKKKKDKVSIITTFYNCERFLSVAIASINAQLIDPKVIDVEYVLVDDHSTDKSYEIAQNILKNNFANKNIKVKLMQTPENLGCGGARKFGIDNATGDYFMFLDADDYYMNIDFVQRAYNDITSQKADIIEYGILINEPQFNRRRPAVLGQAQVIENTNQALLSLFLEAKIRFNVWNKIYTSYIVHSFPYDTTRTYEDIRTIPIWVQNAGKIVIMPSVEVNWRANSSSIIRNDGIETRIGTCTALAEMCEIFKENKQIAMAVYDRAMIDFLAVLDGHTSDDPGFNELAALNRKMLSILFPDAYKNFTYNLGDPDEKESAKAINGGMPVENKTEG